MEHEGKQPHQNFDQAHGDGQVQQLVGSGGGIRPGTATARMVVLAGRGDGSFRGEAQ